MYLTFDAFRPHFMALERAGYFKIVFRKTTTWGAYFHIFYRILVWCAVIIYNLQHIIRAFQVRKCTEQLVGTLFILLTTLNALGKQIAFNVHVGRIDKIIAVITEIIYHLLNGRLQEYIRVGKFVPLLLIGIIVDLVAPYLTTILNDCMSCEVLPALMKYSKALLNSGESFAPKNAYHEDVMKINADSMSGLLVLYHIAIAVCGSLFTFYPLINRALGQPVFITGYFPFNITESPVFELVVIFMGISLTLQAYGHVTMDCTIVSFYVQAKTQLQIFRYNLEHLTEEVGRETDLIYIDDDVETKKLLHEKFVNCVQHYGQIIWLVKEVESIFSEATTVQLVVMVWVICMTVYKIVGLSILSAEFITMSMYLGCMLAQLYIYCYFGTHLKVESELVNGSMYQSAWLSLSPAFRRHLLVLMERCKRNVEPRTAYVIPLSLETFISVLKSSYTLFTILDRK